LGQREHTSPRRARGVLGGAADLPSGGRRRAGAIVYAFEDYELDVHRCELRYAGKLVKIEPQVLNVLAYLIQDRDRVVTKEELLAQLWPGRFVTVATLTSRLIAARRGVGDWGRRRRSCIGSWRIAAAAGGPSRAAGRNLFAPGARCSPSPAG
jgi:DNA-binding response OmpR family regulator